VPELLRPPPPTTWSDRARTALETARERPGRLLAAGAGLVVVVIAGLLLLRAPSTPPAPALPRADATGAPEAVTSTTVDAVVVDVVGAVVKPGLVRLPQGSRVADALEAAGGLTPVADRDRLNLAAPLSDGQRIYVPARGQEVPPDLTASGGGGSTTATADAIVDLNTATLDDLDRLPGVGPATAQAILDYRRQHGRFRTVDELLEVRGIGAAKLDQLRPRVRV
jgi:competence protein ComEA